MMYLYLQTGNRVRILLADSLQFYFALSVSPSVRESVGSLSQQLSYS